MATRSPLPPPLPTAPPLPPQDRDDRPRWVWTAAVVTAVGFAVPLCALIVVVVTAMAVDFSALDDPDRVNDDGTGWLFAIGLFILPPLLLGLALAVGDIVLAVKRQRLALYFHAVVGVLGALLATSAPIVLPLFVAIAAFAIAGIRATSRRATRVRA